MFMYTIKFSHHYYIILYELTWYALLRGVLITDIYLFLELLGTNINPRSRVHLLQDLNEPLHVFPFKLTTHEG